MRTAETLTPKQVEALKAAIAQTWAKAVSEAIAKALQIPYASDKGAA